MKKLIITLMALVALCATSVAQNRVKYLSTASEKLNVSELQVIDQTVQISRFLFAGYNTLCLPMTLSAEQLQAAAIDVRVERLVAVQQEGSTLNLYFLDCTAEGIQAGVPYLIFSPKMQNLRARSNDALDVNTDLQTIRLSDANGNRISFGSSYESLTGEAKRYGIPAKQDVEVLESILLPTDPEKTFLPTRCGFTWEQQSTTATALQIKHAASINEVTAIKGLQNEQAEQAAYDLSGRRVSTTNSAHSSIYVIGGKKVAVK